MNKPQAIPKLSTMNEYYRYLKEVTEDDLDDFDEQEEQEIGPTDENHSYWND